METAIQMPELDAEGYLVDPQDWTEALAEVFALQENISLTEDHWDVIRFMREYYEEHQIAVDARYVIKHLSDRLGPGSRNKLFELFPYGYRQAGMQDRRDEAAAGMEHGLKSEDRSGCLITGFSTCRLPNCVASPDC